MKYIIISTFWLIFLAFYCCKGGQIIKREIGENSEYSKAVDLILQNSVKKKHMTKKGKRYDSNIYHKIEAQLNLDTIDLRHLCIINSFDIESGETNGFIFLNDLTINFTYSTGKLIYKEKYYYPPEMIESLKKFDINCVVKEEPWHYPHQPIYLGYYKETPTGFNIKSDTCRLERF
jgi:hypothetical protein